MSQPGTPAADQQSVSSSAAMAPPRREARHAARRAVEASAAASSLHNDTLSMRHDSSLQDLKLPCIPVSPLGAQTETMRTVSADRVLPSPWCEVSYMPSFTVPADENDARLAEILKLGLRSLSFGGRPLSYTDATRVADILGAGAIERLNLSDGAIDGSRAPEVPPKLLEAAISELEAEIGPEDDEANVEKLQAMCEKAKIEFTGFEAAIKALAAKPFDRINVLVAALLKNYTVKHLDVSRNNLGAPNADGRAQYQTLRRLGVVLDETKGLRSVDFSGNAMGPAGCGIVTKALTKNITIHTVNLCGNELMVDPPDEDDDPENEEGDPVFGEVYLGMESLAELVKKNKFLRVLSLRNNRMRAEIEADGEDEGWDTPLGKFLEPFKKYHRLEVLDLSSNELGAAGARMVAAALMPNKSVKSLDISDNDIGLVGLDWLAKLLGSNNTLTSLHLQRNKITWNKKSKRATKGAFEVFGRFAAALSGNSTLTELNMAGHHFGVDVCDALLEGFANSRVTSLTFDSNNLCGEPDVNVPDTRALEKILAATRREEFPIKALRLASNRLMAGGAALVASALLPSVEELDLRRNLIGDEGCTALCEAIGASVVDSDDRKCSLRVLKLGYNALRDVKGLAGAMPKLQALRHLDLGHNQLGANAEGFAAFIATLGQGSLLREVVLESNSLGAVPEHADALESLFKRAQAPLSRIDLYDNPRLGLDDTLRLIAALKDNNAIRVVRISSQAGDRYPLAEAVQRTLEANRVLTDIDLCFSVDIDDEDLISGISFKLTTNAVTGIVDV